jgi:hypothetical protein
MVDDGYQYSKRIGHMQAAEDFKELSMFLALYAESFNTPSPIKCVHEISIDRPCEKCQPPPKPEEPKQ